MPDRQVRGRKGSQKKPKQRPASKGARQRPAAQRGHGKPFQPGQNSHTGETFRRGPDLIGRGTVVSLYQALLDDDGTLEKSLANDPRFRATLARGFFKAARAKSPRLAILAAETIADRLEGRPVQKVEAVNFPQAVFYRAGDPLPPGVAPPVPDKDAPSAALPDPTVAPMPRAA